MVRYASLLHRLAGALGRGAHREQTEDPFDTYARHAPSAQQTVDIFKGCWSSRFPDRVPVEAGAAQLFEDIRLQQLIGVVGGVNGARVLELGPLEGAHSDMLERAGAREVIAVEACALSYLKCLVVKELIGLRRTTFHFGNFMQFLNDTADRFDVIVASGVLYHQRDPIQLIRLLSEHTDVAFVWTHYYDAFLDGPRIERQCFVRRPAVALHGFECDLFRLDYDAYLPSVKYRGGVDDYAHWMQRDDILRCLRHFGLSDISIAAEQLDHVYGPNMNLVARRPSGRT
jgi:hypothetical protein